MEIAEESLSENRGEAKKEHVGQSTPEKSPKKVFIKASSDVKVAQGTTLLFVPKATP